MGFYFLILVWHLCFTIDFLISIKLLSVVNVVGLVHLSVLEFLNCCKIPKKYIFYGICSVFITTILFYA